MYRVVTTVVLAVALLGVTVPALDLAAHERVDTTVGRDADRLAGAARELTTAEDATRSLATAPRRIVALHVPATTWSRHRVAAVSVESGDPGSVRYRFAGGEWRRHSVGVPIVATGGSVRLRDPGRHRVSLALVLDGRRPVVVVERVTDVT